MASTVTNRFELQPKFWTLIAGSVGVAQDFCEQSGPPCRPSTLLVNRFRTVNNGRQTFANVQDFILIPDTLVRFSPSGTYIFKLQVLIDSYMSKRHDTSCSGRCLERVCWDL